jgi:hypothetical protein
MYIISIELIFAILAGISAKCYDDFTECDENISCSNSSLFSISPYILEFLKQFHTLLYTTISIRDYAFAIPMYIGNLLNSLINPKAYSTPYENSLKYVLLIPCIVSFFYRYSLNRYDILIILFFISSLSLEPLMPIVKNDGIYKMIFRMICCIEYAGILYILYRMNKKISTGVQKIILYAVGYLFTSCIFQWIMIRKQNKKVEINEEKIIKESGIMPEVSRIMPEVSRIMPEVSRIMPEIPRLYPVYPHHSLESTPESPIVSPPNHTINNSGTRVLDNIIEKSGMNTITISGHHSINQMEDKLENTCNMPEDSANIPRICP